MNKFGIKVLALMLCASAFALNAQSQASILESYLVTDSGAGNDYKTASTADGYYFGFFRTGNTFLLKGAEIQSTSDDATGNVCSGTLHYRIYKECETPGSFLTVALPFCCDEGGTDCDGGACNVPASGAGITNQKWRSNTETINILSGLTKGDYILEFYTSATGSTTSNADCSETLLFDNSSSNFKGQFSVGEEGFADGNFSANPTWTGNTGSFTVLDPTTLAGSGSNANINGSGVDNPTVLVSNLGVIDAALVKASSQAYGVWEFSVATGSGWSPSDANNAMIVLTSDTNDPTKLIIDSGTGAPDFNGYAIKFGQDGSLDSFRLVKQTGTLSEEILDTGYPAAANFFSAILSAWCAQRMASFRFISILVSTIQMLAPFAVKSAMWIILPPAIWLW
jgi:hypothetical protein